MIIRTYTLSSALLETEVILIITDVGNMRDIAVDFPFLLLFSLEFIVASFFRF